MTEPDPQDLRRLLGELAGEAPAAVDRVAVGRLATRRRAGLLTGAAAAVTVCGLVGAVALQPSSATDTLKPAPLAVEPSTASPTPEPTVTPAPPLAPSPTPEASSSGEPEPGAIAAPPGTGPTDGLPATFYAADGSRVAAYRTSDGARTSWLSPEVDGFGAGSLALSRALVLYGLGNGDTRDVRTVVHPARRDTSPGILSDPGGLWPAVLPDGSRYAFLTSGDDAAYTPRSPDDLRLILHEADGGVQAVDVDPTALIDGLAFASPDRLVLAVDPARPDPVGSGLQVYDFQTDEAPLGDRAPDEHFLPPPAGCAWTLPTATPTPDEVLVLQRCNDSGRFDAVVVDVRTGRVVAEFGAVRGEGPGQVDSLDLDSTGRHLIAQIHDGQSPRPPGSSPEPAPTRPVLETRRLPGGQTITTTTSLVSPVWD